MGTVGTVSVSPSTSLPYFPLGSQETEVKVAAGALRTDLDSLVGMVVLVLVWGCLLSKQLDAS